MKKYNKGLAVVEFTIVAPIIILMMMATAEFGNALMQYNTLTKAIRGGAMYAADNGIMGVSGSLRLDTDLQLAVENLVNFGNITGSGSALLTGTAPTIILTGNGQDITVSATYEYQPIFNILPMFYFGGDIGTNFTLQSSIRVRAL